MKNNKCMSQFNSYYISINATSCTNQTILLFTNK